MAEKGEKEDEFMLGVSSFRRLLSTILCKTLVEPQVPCPSLGHTGYEQCCDHPKSHIER